MPLERLFFKLIPYLRAFRSIVDFRLAAIGGRIGWGPDR